MSKSQSRNWSITLTPHRSLSRQGFIAVMVLVAAVNLLAGLLFYALGAWPVVGFLGADVLVMWWAFRRNFADSERAERITAAGHDLTLRRFANTHPPEEIQFNRRWVQVHMEYDEARELAGRLYLRSRGQGHEIASFLGAEERQSLAKALRQAI